MGNCNQPQIKENVINPVKTDAILKSKFKNFITYDYENNVFIVTLKIFNVTKLIGFYKSLEEAEKKAEDLIKGLCSNVENTDLIKDAWHSVLVRD